jgi:hypothetical protein
MIRTAYILSNDITGTPVIIKCDITNVQGVSWREAKKQLRQWYLDKAASLRTVSEREYFNVESKEDSQASWDAIEAGI